MEFKKRQRGPAMDWLDSVPNQELVDLFAERFFGGDYKKKSAFRCGSYRAGAHLALEMVQWWASFGVQVRPGQIRPDIWGENDRGPSKLGG